MENKGIQTILRLRIKDALHSLKPSVYPHFHSLIQTKEGYLKAEKMVIQYVVTHTVPVSSAIAHLETEMA